MDNHVDAPEFAGNDCRKIVNAFILCQVQADGENVAGVLASAEADSL
jgi:hypothetical protein